MALTNVAAAEFFEGPAVSNSLKAQRRETRKMEREVKQYRRNPKPLQPRTHNQAYYIDSLTENELTFGIGPAGTGKTYVPSRIYGEMLISGRIKKLYLARPNISKAKHRNGFLPGTLEEKTAPWLVPIFEGLADAMGKTQLEFLRKSGAIEVVPYEFIQGRTFRDEGGAACIIDEAENLDIDDLYITLTRQGEGLNMVLCGDIYQARIPDSGLAAVVEMAVENEMDSVGIVEFTEEDVVRSRQAKQWVAAFRGKHLLHDVSKRGIEGKFSSHDTPTFLKGSC